MAVSINKISAVITVTTGEDKYLEDCLKSLTFVDEIVVIDNASTDKSVEIAKSFTDKIYSHKFISYVEPLRNFGIAKASYGWILILDPDEIVPATLGAKLIEIANESNYDFVRIPRKNLIFGQWVKHSRWWPDHNIRFFKKGSVTWQNEIHSVPVTNGNGLTLESEPSLALEHHHYSTIDEYLMRQIRYTNEQAKELLAAGYQFNFFDAVNKPIGEFLSRFFAGEGYKDGFHGFVLAVLQAFSFFMVYLKVWQEQGFTPQSEIVTAPAWRKLISDRYKEVLYWIYTVKIHLSPKKTGRFFLKLKRKLIS